MARLLSFDGRGIGRARASSVVAIATTASEKVTTRSADRASISGESVVAMGEDCAVAIPFAPAPGPPGRRRNLQRGSPVPDSAPDDAGFVADTEPFRRELLAHCYRLLGSIPDAEDLVQETSLRAWRAYGGFEGRSSVRTWLDRITEPPESRARALLNQYISAF